MTNPCLPETNGDTQKPESDIIGGESNYELETEKVGGQSNRKDSNSCTNNGIVRRERPTRACTTRPAKYVDLPVIGRRPRPAKREKVEKEVVEVVEEEEQEEGEPCNKIVSVTPLTNEPTLEQMPRWRLRSMWELASILNFFNVS